MLYCGYSLCDYNVKIVGYMENEGKFIAKR
jgi:hypothetical protein